MLHILLVRSILLWRSGPLILHFVHAQRDRVVIVRMRRLVLFYVSKVSVFEGLRWGYVYAEVFCNFAKTDCCVCADSRLFVALSFG